MTCTASIKNATSINYIWWMTVCNREVGCGTGKSLREVKMLAGKMAARTA